MSRHPLSALAAAREDPSRDALVADGRAYSYGELAALVARAGAGLGDLRPGERVAVQATNRVETVVALLALIERGVPFVPLHPKLTPDEAAALIEDAGPARVLDDDALAALGGAPPAAWPAPGDAGELAMLYTSGTSGRPKGARLSRRAFVASARASGRNLGWRDDDRWLLCLPLCHVGGLSVLTRCLAARRCVVLAPRFEPGAALEAIVRARTTLLSVVPTMLRALLEADRDNALAAVRAVLVGGAAAPPGLLEECARRGVQALTTYGLTEACSQVTAQSPRWPPSVEPGSGRALPGVALSVVDDAGSACAAGDVGRIRVRGPTVMDGYLRAAPLAGGWLDTGDLGALDEHGRLHVHARRTDLIVTGGENVYPAEVEAALEALPGVARALVFGVPDDAWGEVVAAAVVPAGAVDEGALWDAVAARLASFKRPRRVCFVDEIPSRSTGKPDRAGAKARFGPLTRPWRR